MTTSSLQSAALLDKESRAFPIDLMPNRVEGSSPLSKMVDNQTESDVHASYKVPGGKMRNPIMAGLLVAAIASVSVEARPEATAANLPDWSGVWTANKGEGNVLDPSAGIRADDPGVRLYPPYNAEWEARYTADLASGIKERDPGANCVRPGMPRQMGIFYAIEFNVTPQKTAILFEYPWNFRQIYTDGRGHPDPEQWAATANGHSVGHWEGQTLVVETTQIAPWTWFDRTGARHSDQLRIVERITRLNDNLMENRLTLYDPVAFTKPWEVRRTYVRDTVDHLVEYVCSENNRNAPTADGTNTVQLSESESH